MPFLPVTGDERLTFRGTTHIPAHSADAQGPVTADRKSVPLSGAAPGRTSGTYRGGSQPVTAPLLDTQARYFPVPRISLFLYTISEAELQGEKR